MASIRERTDKQGRRRYELRLRLGDKCPSRSFTSKVEANRWLKIAEALGDHRALAMIDEADDKPKTGHDLTVKEIIEHHIESLTGVTPGTICSYHASAEANIYPIIGKITTPELDRQAITTWIKTLDGTVSGKTIKNNHGLLSAACATAIERGWLASNPCKGARLPRTDKREARFLTAEEVRQLLETIKYLANERPETQTMQIYLDLTIALVGTGMRWGEATALQRTDIVTHDSILHINVERSWKRGEKGKPYLGPPKTKRSKRIIPISYPSPVIDAVRRRLQSANGKFLFNGALGGPILNSKFHARCWKPVLQILGWDPAPRVHDLRHTAASLMLAGGAPVEAVSRILGHEKTSTTLDIYGHLIPGTRETALAGLGATINAALAQD